MKQNNVWIDTHCHLEMLKGSANEIVRQSKLQGVYQCITIGTDEPSNKTILSLITEFDSVWGTLGVHPHEAEKTKENHFEWIFEKAKKHSKIVAIGECGYDFYYNHSPKNIQETAFCKQMEIALDLNLPVVIHTRDAEEQTIQTMKSYVKKGLRGVFHSFTSSQELAIFGIEHGFYFSFNGICTFPKSEEVRNVLKIIPKDQILLETDAPFLTPVPYRGKPNYPGNTAIVGKYIADFLNLPIDEFSNLTKQNTNNLFNIPLLD